jgi:hypothetical protein
MLNFPGSWSTGVLPSNAGHREVSVHVSNSRRLDWQNKNFHFRTMPMRELVRLAFGEGEAPLSPDPP